MRLTYFQNLNRLILNELEIRSNYFAGNYSPDKQSIVLIPSGAGGRLLQSEKSYYPGQPYSFNLAFRECWLNIISALAGNISELELNSAGLDWNSQPVIASGEMKHLFNVYYGTKQFFSSKLNYIEFGYDWRRGLPAAAGYLRAFLQMIRDKVIKRGYANPLPGLTLFAHSLGGLVVKLFLNELVDDEENTQGWFYRFVSIATSYYGTENHIERYYVGDKLINALAGGAKKVASVLASFPSFYYLMPAPKNILEPKYGSLGLDEYPVRDADNPNLELDPYAPENQKRFSPIIIDRYLNDAKTILEQVDRELPDNVKNNIFHIRNKLPSRSKYPLKLYWKDVVTENYDYKEPSPIRNNGGASDGTTPFWSARLATTPNDQVYDIELSTEHEYLAEAPVVIYIVNRLSHGYGFPAPNDDMLEGAITAADDVGSIVKDFLDAVPVTD